MSREALGVAVIGCGRIGGLRAKLSSAHPGVGFLALSDANRTQADVLAQQTGADLVTTDNLAAISDERVGAVFISTPEHDHRTAVIQALEAGKAVFVEKPIALTVEDADAIIEAVERTGAELRVGYSRRHDRRWMLAKEQIVQGRVGEVLGIQSRVYNSRAQLMEILKRAPDATPVNDVLTYYVDMACWYLEGIRPVEVVARAQSKVFKALGHKAADVT
ncbi:MAG: Gfo/Idh/MocA family oxidoreductase, partial [Rhodospirillaceae bacterium]